MNQKNKTLCNKFEQDVERTMYENIQDTHKNSLKDTKGNMFHIYWLAWKQTHRSTEQNSQARKKRTPIYCQLAYEKGAKNIQWGKENLFKNGTGQNG